MDNALYIALTRQQTLRRSMEVVANNVANMSTPGFKAERPLFEPAIERPASHQDGPRKISFVQDWGVLRDFTEGAFNRTGNALDVAISGEGFFAVKSAGETLYTRDGRFSITDQGQLVARDGAAVLDEAGGEITLDPAAGEPIISATGAISQNGAEVARLQVVRFDAPGALSKVGDVRFAANGAAAQAVEAPRLQQGFVEGSNVNGIAEITRSIEIQRAYSSVTRALQQAEELRNTAIDRLGRSS